MIIILLLVLNVCSAKDVFTIGGLFHDDNYQAEMAFKYALERYNMFNHDVEFHAIIERVKKADSFAVNKLVCEMVSADEGVVALFGPESKEGGAMVRSIAANLEIPHISTQYLTKTQYVSTTALNIYPDFEILSTAIATVVKHMEWQSFMIIYETNEGLVKLQEVLKLAKPDSPPVTIRQLDSSDDQRPLFKLVKKSKQANIILDCSKDRLMEVLIQAKEVGLLEYFYDYLLTDLDAHTLDFSVLQTSANITTIRIFDTNNQMLQNTVRDWEMGELNRQHFIQIAPTEVTTEAALMHDAVNYFTTAFQELHTTEAIASRPLTCGEYDKWESGFRITTYMKVRPFLNALTGTIKFNEWGKRVEFSVDLVEIYDKEVGKTATWYPENADNLTFTRTADEQMQQIVQNLQKTTVMVSSRLGEPYLRMRKPRYEGEVLEGNNQFEGYSLDLIDAISKELNFTYKFFLTEDAEYGKYDEKKKAWNGLIRDLLERKAHLAICDLTITHARRSAVDFSLPFMTLGVSILYRKPPSSKRNLFAFMDPLDSAVWLYIVSFYISLTLIIYLIARMAPGDWENPHPCDQKPEVLENVWDMKNCLWIMLGSTMSAGCDMLPKGISSRMAISMWWFFILIISSSYTANLAAFLTMDKMGSTIDGAESLAKQTKIKYGTVDGGSTKIFFSQSNFTTYAKMWTQMSQAQPSVFEKDNSAGVKRVLNTKDQLYAFLMESSQIEYEIAKNCSLKQVGGRLDNKGYGIAMPVNSHYRSAINKIVLELQESGTLNKLKNKWWKEMVKRNASGEPCDESQGGSSADLKLENVGGVFLVLGVGVLVAFIFALIEFFWNVHTVAVEQKISHKKALDSEFKFAIKVWITKKRTSAGSSESSSRADNASLSKKDGNSDSRRQLNF